MARPLILSDGGIETYLIFQRGLELPDFAAFHLLRDSEGVAALKEYFGHYVRLAKEHRLGLILESPTWRANPDWARRLGYSQDELDRANAKAIDLLRSIREESGSKQAFLISGCVGPRGDGYQPTSRMSAGEAQAYHQRQIAVFASAGADIVTAITMNYLEEALGIARSAADLGICAAISFTVETDGRLPSGQALGDAIAELDRACEIPPAYYMVNCAHPTHFARILQAQEPWVGRIHGLRANASAKSHAELNESSELDAGNPEEFGRQYAELFKGLGNLRVIGGCCGTDHRHVAAAAKAVLAFRD